MVTFIKDIACWCPSVTMVPIGCLHHHQRVIGNHNISAFCGADRFFHKTTIVMRTGRMDTFAPPIGKACRLCPPKQVHQPCWKTCASQVAIIAGTRPSRHQPKNRRIAGAPRHLRQRLFQIQQTEVIFPTLANHDLAGTCCRIRVKPTEFICDLVL